jgi:DNA polymerase I-like protein with 3'-5' exonuclease and polymerase domains
MRLRDNDVGLCWDRSIKVQKQAPRQFGSFRPVLPSSTWCPPTEFPSLQGIKRISFDLETRDEELSIKGPGVRRPDCYVVGWGVGTDDGRRWYFPTRHEGGGNLDEGVVVAYLRDELNAFRGTVTGAKLDYDLDWAAEHGITFANAEGFDDVQIAEPLLDEWRYEFSLNALAQDYLKETKREELLQQAAAIYGWKDNTEIKRNLWRLPANLVGPYAEGDLDLPLRIFELQRPKLEAEGLGPIYSIERRLIPILVAMRRRGVRVNIDRADEVRAGLVKKREEYIAEMRRLSTPKAELMIPQSFLEALRDRGVVVPLTEKTKKPSITKALFEKYEGDDLIDAIAAGRKINTVINTFLDGHILGHQIKGRVHCEWKQLKDDGGGTIARIAAANPNLANVPARDEELAPLVRGIFLPEEGEQWQSDDENQIEYRIGAHFGIGKNAEEVRKKYRDDPKTDFHKLTAVMCGVDPEDSRKRKRVKSINFAKGYGAQENKLAMLMRCSIGEAKDFIELYDTNIPFMKDSFEAAQKWAQKQGYVTSILGRRQHFNLWVPAGSRGGDQVRPLRRAEAEAAYGMRLERYKAYAAWNRKLQSSNADIMKKSMVDAKEAGLLEPASLGALLITIYDELNVSVPPTRIGDEAGKELTRLMERVVELKVPIYVTSKRGANWGEVS